MDGIIIDGKRHNADEVADMLHDNDDDEVVAYLTMVSSLMMKKSGQMRNRLN